MTIAEIFREEGRQEGKRKIAKEIASRLLKMGVDIQIISEVTKLPISELSQEESQ